jgi:hypothetical protein
MRPAWVLLVAVLILASSAETLGAPLAVRQGVYETTSSIQDATFSGDNNLAVSFTTSGGIGSTQVFTTGILDGGLGSLGPPFLVGGGPGGTIQVDNVSCNTPANPNCGAALRFINPVIPIGPPNMPNGVFAGDAPFTMTGQLQIGTLFVDIVGSGFVHAECTSPTLCGPGSFQRYDFVAAEPSTVVLVLSGLVAVGWSRWRGGKRAGSSRSTATAD